MICMITPYLISYMYIYTTRASASDSASHRPVRARPAIRPVSTFKVFQDEIEASPAPQSLRRASEFAESIPSTSRATDTSASADTVSTSGSGSNRLGSRALKSASAGTEEKLFSKPLRNMDRPSRQRKS